LALLTQNKAKVCKNLIITLVFEKNANFFAESWQKSPKIVIITSTPGTDVMILKIFSPKNSAKKLALLTQNKATLCKNLIKTLVFEKNANFFAESWQKTQKIVIISSTPGFKS
jgi:hypothetical protein